MNTVSDAVEIWKPVTGYEKFYEVSNQGRVRSLTRTVTRRNRWNPDKPLIHIREGRLLRLIDADGYKYLPLTKNDKQSNYRVHRLVAIAFIPNPENKPEINHIDKVRDNNRVENLEWCTHSENMQHACRTFPFRNYSNRPRGEKSATSIWTDRDVIGMRKMHKEGKNRMEIMKVYNIKKPTLDCILYNRTWKHIKDNEI